MNKEKIKSLEKYLYDLKSRLASPPNPKQVNRVKEYHQWLNFEIAAVKAKLDTAKTA